MSTDFDLNFLEDLNLSDEETESRAECQVCLRPKSACWCRHVANPRVKSETRLVILQHPSEVKRNIRTCRMLELGLEEDCVHVFRGRKFPGNHVDLTSTLNDPSTCLLYPGQDSVSLEKCDRTSISSLVILDGTWDQARKIYNWNPVLQKLRKVSLSVSRPSEYIVRTQPTKDCMSTLEAGVHSLAILENRPEIVEPLLAPLVSMCNTQISHGAVNHDSQDMKTIMQENHQYQKRKPQFKC